MLAGPREEYSGVCGRRGTSGKDQFWRSSGRVSCWWRATLTSWASPGRHETMANVFIAADVGAFINHG